MSWKDCCPAHWPFTMRKLRRYGFLLLIMLLLVIPQLFPGADIVERAVGPPVNWIIRALLPDFIGLRRRAGIQRAS